MDPSVKLVLVGGLVSLLSALAGSLLQQWLDLKKSESRTKEHPTQVIYNTAEGRIKDRNLQARSRVAVCIPDPKDPYRYIQIRGRVVARTHEGADQHIDLLNRRYLGVPFTPKPGQVRVIYKILPERVDAQIN